jgi:hypothetical protein
MELENFKQLFLEHSSKPVAYPPRTDIHHLLKRRSGAPVASLKKKLYAELIIAIIFCSLPVYIFIAYKGQYVSALAVVFLLVAALFIRTILHLLSAVSRYETAVNAVRQHLQLLVVILKKFRRLYIVSSMLVLPLFTAAAGVLVHLDNLQKDPLLYQLSAPYTTVMYILFSLLWAVGMYFFTRWYVDKMYGQQIRQLQTYIDEMQ